MDWGSHLSFLVGPRMVDKGRLAAARRIVQSLENALEVAENKLQPNGHDDNEALLVTLHRALDAARNVARNYGEKN